MKSKEKIILTEFNIIDTELVGKRLELYELFRKKHPKGKEEAQIKMC